MSLRCDIVDYINQFKNMITGLEDKETVSEKEMLEAFSVLNFAKYLNVYDIFLGISAMNLLNTYVKQAGNDLSYRFRTHLIRILQAIVDLDDKNIITSHENNKGIILIIQIYGVQFSFHGETHYELLKKCESKETLKWDGIKKQPFASSIFRFAISSPYISDKTEMKLSLLDTINAQLKCMNQGNISLNRGNLVKYNYIPESAESFEKLKSFVIMDIMKTTRPVIYRAFISIIGQNHLVFKKVALCCHEKHNICLWNTVIPKENIDLSRLDNRAKNGEIECFLIGVINNLYDDIPEILLCLNNGYPAITEYNKFDFFTPGTLDNCHRPNIKQWLSNHQHEFQY